MKIKELILLLNQLPEDNDIYFESNDSGIKFNDIKVK